MVDVVSCCYAHVYIIVIIRINHVIISVSNIIIIIIISIISIIINIIMIDINTPQLPAASEAAVFTK